MSSSHRSRTRNPSPEDVKSYVATCKVMGVIKGTVTNDVIQIPYYGHIFDLHVHLAAPLVQTTQRQHEWVQ